MSQNNGNQNQNAAPLYVQFAMGIHAAIRDQGLPAPTLAETPTGFPENDGYFFVEWGQHGIAPALIVPKSKTRMGSIDSHLDLSGCAGHVPLGKRNGKVVCRLEADLSKVAAVLPTFASGSASKRPTAAPVRRLSGVGVQSASAVSPIDSRHAAPTPMARLPEGPSEYDAPARPVTPDVLVGDPYSDSEAEAAMAALDL